MKTSLRKQKNSFPKKKISAAVRNILPHGKPFKLKLAGSNIGDMKIVRVITPAWSSLRPAARIGKVLQAVKPELTPAEQKKILRFSVLTPEEYAQLILPRTSK